MAKSESSNNKKTSSGTVKQAIYGSPDYPLKIGDFEIPCYILEDGTRVLVRNSMVNALDMKTGTATASTKGDRLTKFLATKSLRDFVTPELAKAIHDPIRFRTPTGTEAFGYEATVLADICEVVLSAREKTKLNYQQEHIVHRCQILVRGFARVGIIALVDEVTGYQDVRSRAALEEILQKFISDELLAWAKVFPDDFYKELFRLRGLQYSQLTTKRPPYIGKLTSNIVYERLAPGVLNELKRITPRDEKGRRKHKFFQRLTEDIGHEKLREHLSNVLTLMRASPNYRVFYRLLERSLPKYNSQPSLGLEVRDDSSDEMFNF